MRCCGGSTSRRRWPRPGVAAVWTGADIADLPPIDFRDPAGEALRPYRQPLLAQDRLRYVGEPVAVVFATDAYLAEDAADLVDDRGRRAAAGSRRLGGARQLRARAVHRADWCCAPNTAMSTRRSPRRTRSSRSTWRSAGTAACRSRPAARWRVTTPARDVLELYGAAKVPHRNRDALARMFGRSAAGVVLKEGNTGGGFGIRGELYPEDFLVCLAALRLGRPVKWIEDRREHLMAANHSRQQRHHARAAVDAEGRILALDDEFWLDQGAYVRTHGARVPEMTIAMLPGPYRIPAYRAVGHFRLTNKTPAATYRAPGRYEGTLRARAADRCRRRPARARPADRPPPQPDRRGGDAVQPAAERARHRGGLRFRRLRAAARQGAGADRLGGAASRSCDGGARPANWSAPASRSLSRRAGSVRWTAPASRSTRPARSSW